MKSGSTSLASVEEVVDAVRGGGMLSISGADTKPGLRHRHPEARRIDLRGLKGMIDYQPGEYVFTAWAGTPVRDIAAVLAGKGQHLPFDPLFAASGSTLGGMIASGMNGPGRLRYGGMRDFIVGIELVDGQGRVVRGGGRVVKNAAGFDFPKLLTGSLGRLGIITQATFKVFPQPRAAVTVRMEGGEVESAVRRMEALARGPWDIDALEWLPGEGLVVRLAGHDAALRPRVDALSHQLGLECQLIEPEPARRFWSEQAEWSWMPAGHCRVKVPLVAGAMAAFDEGLRALGVTQRRYTCAGACALIGWPERAGLPLLDGLLRSHRLAGLCLDVCGDGLTGPLLGAPGGREFEDRIRRVLDPHQKFAR